MAETKSQVAVPKQQSPMQLVCTGIERMESGLRAALPPNVTVERFIQTAKIGIQTHRDAAKLLNCDRRSLYNSVSKAAADGLMLDGREAVLAPFGEEAQYMIMVQGLLKLARNSGEIASIIAEPVYSLDKFTYRIGVDATPIHEPEWFAEDRGKPIGVWAMVTLTNGQHIVSILNRQKINNISKRSRAAKNYDPNQGLDWDEWWKKAAIRNVLKLAPKSSALQQAIEHDNEAEGHAFDDEPPIMGRYEDVEAKTGDQSGGEPAEPKKRRTRASDAVAAKAKAPPPPEAMPEGGPPELDGDYRDVTDQGDEQDGRDSGMGDTEGGGDTDGDGEEEIPI
jgi:recombination protein RecT